MRRDDISPAMNLLSPRLDLRGRGTLEFLGEVDIRRRALVFYLSSLHTAVGGRVVEAGGRLAQARSARSSGPAGPVCSASRSRFTYDLGEAYL